MTTMSTLYDVIYRLLFDESVRASYLDDPEAFLTANGLDGLTSSDVGDAFQQVCNELPPGLLSRDDGLERNYYSTGGNAAPTTQVNLPPPVAGESDIEGSIRTINYITQNYSYTSIEDNDQIIDNSVDQTVLANGDVFQDFDNDIVIAEGDGAQAAGGDVVDVDGNGNLVAGGDQAIVGSTVATGAGQVTEISGNTITADDGSAVSIGGPASGYSTDDDVVNTTNFGGGQTTVNTGEDGVAQSVNIDDSFNDFGFGRPGDGAPPRDVPPQDPESPDAPPTDAPPTDAPPQDPESPDAPPTDGPGDGFGDPIENPVDPGSFDEPVGPDSHYPLNDGPDQPVFKPVESQQQADFDGGQMVG